MAAPTADPATGAIETNALVVGAGPVALWQVFQLGLLEIHAELVDVLPALGGQCTELYPDKPIYDIPGLPMVSGAGLVDGLARQMAPFRPGLHLGQLVTGLQPTDDGRFAVTTDRGTRFVARAVVIAAGTGAFLPRLPRLDGIERWLGSQVLAHPPTADQAAAQAGRQVVVLGDDDTALDTACTLAEAGQATRVTLLHRRDAFRADPAAVARQQALREAGRLHFVAAQPQHLLADGDRLVALQVATADDATLDLPCDTLLPLLGLSPRLGPIADWGLALERKLLAVDPAQCQTSVPGIFAVGDAITYPGKKKLLLCGFHEATLAAWGCAARLFPGQRIPLEYTTSSTRLHRLLGVADSHAPAANGAPADHA